MFQNVSDQIKEGLTNLEEDNNEVSNGEMNQEESHPRFSLVHRSLPRKDLLVIFLGIDFP